MCQISPALNPALCVCARVGVFVLTRVRAFVCARAHVPAYVRVSTPLYCGASNVYLPRLACVCVRMRHRRTFFSRR